MSQPNPLSVSIDATKTTLDITASSTIELFFVGNDGVGSDTTIAELRKRTNTLVLMETTGEHEATVAYVLPAEGFEIAVVNPKLLTILIAMIIKSEEWNESYHYVAP